MATKDEERNLLWFTRMYQILVGDQQTAYIKRMGTVLTPYLEGAVQRSARFIADTILDTPVDRVGLGKGIGNGKTTLRAFIANNDDHVVRILSKADEAATPAEVGAELAKVAPAPAALRVAAEVDVVEAVEGGK